MDHIDSILKQWKTQQPELDCSPIAVIGRVERAKQLIEKRIVPTFKEYALSNIEFDILATMRRNATPLTPTELYRSLMLSSGAVSTRIEQLVKRGLIERQYNEEDRRSCHVVLTEAGIELINAAFKAHINNEKELLAPLTTTEQTELAALLKKWLLANE